MFAMVTLNCLLNMLAEYKEHNFMTVYNSAGDSDGTCFGQSGEKIGFFGATPVVVQTLGTAAPTAQPAPSSSAIIASVQSLAAAACSLANANRLVLSNLGLAE